MASNSGCVSHHASRQPHPPALAPALAASDQRGLAWRLRLLLLQWQPDHFQYNFDMTKGPVKVEWFKGGKTNISYNCLDRWVAA
jgi:hypothetical protein